MKLVVALILAGCHGTPAATTPSNTSSTTNKDFCDAMKSSKQADAASVHAATEAMHAALVASGASDHADATAELVAWLHAQACVTSVEPASGLIETQPPIRTIKILVKVSETLNNACTAELRLAPGAKLSMECTSLIDI